MSTHIGAAPGQIAPTVLLPGDPLRARHIAETYLEDAVCHSSVRGMYGYTGTYKGRPVSVQGTGMGAPSISIYVHELVRCYGCRTLIRIGTAGSLSESYPLGHTVLAQAACSDGGINPRRFGGLQFAPVADFGLLSRAASKADELGIAHSVGTVISNDLFYEEGAEERHALLKACGIWAVEMETCELYSLAPLLGFKALAILTISDLMFGTFAQTTAEEREKSNSDMIRLALELA